MKNDTPAGTRPPITLEQARELALQTLVAIMQNQMAPTRERRMAAAALLKYASPRPAASPAPKAAPAPVPPKPAAPDSDAEYDMLTAQPPAPPHAKTHSHPTPAHAPSAAHTAPKPPGPG